MSFYIINEGKELFIDSSASKSGDKKSIVCKNLKKKNFQQFVIKENKIISVYSGKVLESDPETGNLYFAAPSHTSSQLFFFDPDGTIRNVNDLCLTLSLSKGFIIAMRKYKGSPTQKWRIVTFP